MAVQGKDWWFAPAGAAFLSVITGIIFSLQGSDWTDDPIQWALIGMVFVVTLVREWGLKLVAGADWLRVNRKWVDTYALTRIELRGVWFGWMLRLKDSEGRHLRTYMTDLEANRDLWALVYNGMLHSAFHGATVNNTAAGMLRLRPGFEAMRYQERHRGPKIPDRTVWTILLVIVGVFAAIYFLRPDLLGRHSPSSPASCSSCSSSQESPSPSPADTNAAKTHLGTDHRRTTPAPARSFH